MDLCQDAVDGLKVLKSSRIDQSTLDELAKKVMSTLAGDGEFKVESVTKADLKLVTLSLGLLFTEAARINSSLADEVSTIKSVLEDVELSTDTISCIIKAYEMDDLRDKLNDHLRNLRIKNSSIDRRRRLLDVDWRQELIVKSKNVQHKSQVNYLISLRTDKEDNDERLTFKCTLEQLQDLVYKVRECAKVVEQTLTSEASK